MIYNIRLEEINAEAACPPQGDGELHSEWMERIQMSIGKTVFRVAAASEGSDEGFEVYSPFFDTGNIEQTINCIGNALGKMAAEIINREHPEMKVREKPLLATDPAQNARFLRGRKRN